MLEVAVWIGVVVVGLAVLAFLEVLRSNSFICAHREEIRMALPTVALCALASTAGAMVVLFLFRFFLGDVWQYALPVAIFLFVLLVWRIRQQQSEERSAAHPEPWSGSRLKPIFTLATQVAEAAAVPVLMIPVLAGAFLIVSFLGHMSHVVAWPHLVLALAAIFAVGYYLLRQRTAGPDHPNEFGSDC